MLICQRKKIPNWLMETLFSHDTNGFSVLFCLVLKAESHSIAQAGLKLTM